MLNKKKILIWLNKRIDFYKKEYNLNNIKFMLKILNNPEKKINFIHIAGTNGKGSVISYLKSMFIYKKIKVGSFISPHIIDFNERISINDKNILDKELFFYLNKYKKIIENNIFIKKITFFEILTVVAIEYFYDKNVDVVLMEVGLGGKFDSTNVIFPVLTVITTIGKDHMEVLGNSISKITFNKAGIIKKKVPIIIGKVNKESLNIIKKISFKKKCKLYIYKLHFYSEYLFENNNINYNEKLNFFNNKINFYKIKILLLGKHQIDNVSVAIQVFYLYLKIKFKILIKENDIKNGLLNTFWPGRMEIIKYKKLKIILDGAHNMPAILQLIYNLENIRFKNKIKYILFSALYNKDFINMFDILYKKIKAKFFLTSFKYIKSIKLDEINKIKKKYYNISIISWKDLILNFLNYNNLLKDDFFLITGSLYFVSEVRKFLYKKFLKK